jgi:hypothetical protein
MNADEFMNEREVAALLRQPLMMIQEWRRIGYMPPHIRVAFKVILYRKADVHAWLESKRVEPTLRRRHPAQERQEACA